MVFMYKFGPARAENYKNKAAGLWFGKRTKFALMVPITSESDLIKYGLLTRNGFSLTLGLYSAKIKSVSRQLTGSNCIYPKIGFLTVYNLAGVLKYNSVTYLVMYP